MAMTVNLSVISVRTVRRVILSSGDVIVLTAGKVIIRAGGGKREGEK